MSDEKQETISDIVAEMRDVAKSDRYTVTANPKILSPTVFGKPICAYFAEAADRLEAAWNRERGNAAAMRKALLDIQEYAAAMDVDDGNVLAILDSCRDGLSAPQKNCDRFKTRKEARNYFDDFVCLRSNGSGAIDCKGCPLDSIDSPHRADCREAWLFSPAAERKGEGDEK